MRAIRIDHHKRTVYAVELEPGAVLRGLQAAVGGCIEPAGDLPGANVLYVNEEGLLRRPERLFVLRGWTAQPLAGSGIIVGEDPEGETVPADLSVADVWARLVFLERGRDW